MKYKLKNRINNIATTLGKEVIERDTIIKLAILGIFAKESIFLLGPPGVGKSLISRKISSVFKKAKEFSVLMNKFSLPDEIFGPIDINELKEGKFKRKIQNYLPDANIAFLDEIWKASSSIQNTLLTIINEKIFMNDGKFQPINLYFVIAASNELPERNQSLEALWDRFLLKFFVGPIADSNKFLEMINNQKNVLQTKTITTADQLDFQIVDDVNKELETIEVSQTIKNLILEIKAQIEENNKKVLKRNPFADGFDQYYVSDRKWKKILTTIKASAYLNERMNVDFSDFGFMPYMLWNTLEQLDFYQAMVKNLLLKHKYEKVQDKFLEKLNQLRDQLISFTTITHYSKKQVIETFQSHKGINYYRFLDSNKQIYYFVKEEMDSISTKARFSIDWLISYVNQEQFEVGREPLSKLLVKYDENMFYIYEDNDETKEPIQIFTNFQTIEVAEYELVNINSTNLNSWKVLVNDFRYQLMEEIKRIEVFVKQIDSGEVNIFWDNQICLQEKSGAAFAIRQLQFLDEQILEMDSNKDLLKVGFSLTSLERLYEIKMEKRPVE